MMTINCDRRNAGSDWVSVSGRRMVASEGMYNPDEDIQDEPLLRFLFER
jgi:hypothetical protein